jgi:hypothetical protein
MSYLTQDMLHELFEYRDGDLIRKVSTSSNAAAGKIAGHVRRDGYRDIRINGKSYLTHRLVFLMHNGYLPKQVDHIDNERSNNRIQNLRPATNSENLWNQSISSNNASGFKGVSWRKDKKRWGVYVRKDGKGHWGGLHDTPEEANEAAMKLREKLHGEFVRHA